MSTAFAFERVPPVPSRLCWFVLVAGMALGTACAGAATVSVQVADRAGKPLAEAVVMLVPVSGRLPIRPMSGVEIAQSHRQFSPRVTVVTVGTSIAFPNLDTVRHHVYSFSPVKSFELKLYAGVPATPVVFDKPGVATLGCNIHDAMVAWVVVVDTPLFTRSGVAGKAEIDAVPAGDYELRVWHSELPESSPGVSTPLTVAGADIQTRAALATVGSRK
jgi:plastocyanin